MFKYEITFRLDSNTETYQQRYNKLIELLFYQDETTSTLFFESDKGIEDFIKYIYKECNLVKTDTLLVMQIFKGKIIDLYKVNNGKMGQQSKILNWLKA